MVGVSRAALTEGELKSFRVQAHGDTYYRIDVSPDAPSVNVYGHERPLRASMQVEAYVLLDRRRLYEWLFAPLYGLRGGL